MGESLLLQKIEECRAEMISLSYSHGMASEAVIQASKRLDRLLNDYQRMKKAAKAEQYV